MSPWIGVAAVVGGVGVVLGAFGAHGLKARLEPDQLASWQTAVQYHLLHAVALLQLASWQTAVQYHLLHAVALLGLGLFAAQSGRAVGLQAWLFTLGVTLFSGSIYVLVLGGPRWLGPVTPLGGLCLIAGWLSLLLLARS
jgi:uncharacterized membrane protein YgdD (TMEM256/DUF423 family)